MNVCHTHTYVPFLLSQLPLTHQTNLKQLWTYGDTLLVSLWLTKMYPCDPRDLGLRVIVSDFFSLSDVYFLSVSLTVFFVYLYHNTVS